MQTQTEGLIKMTLLIIALAMTATMSCFALYVVENETSKIRQTSDNN